MCMYVCVYLCACTSVYMFVRICEYQCIMFVCICVPVCVCMCVCVCVRLCVCGEFSQKRA